MSGRKRRASRRSSSCDSDMERRIKDFVRKEMSRKKYGKHSRYIRRRNRSPYSRSSSSCSRFSDESFYSKSRRHEFGRSRSRSISQYSKNSYRRSESCEADNRHERRSNDVVESHDGPAQNTINSTPNMTPAKRTETQAAALPNKASQESTQSETGQEKSNEPDKENSSEKSVLREDVIEALGQRYQKQRKLASPVCEPAVLRWGDIINQGIPKEDIDSLINKYPPAENCLFTDPPKLNREVKNSLQSIVVKRDERIQEKQLKITAGIGAASALLNELLKQKDVDSTLVGIISNIGSIFTDLQHDENCIRKNLILSHLNGNLRETLKETQSGEFLFGKDLDEKLKAREIIEKSSKKTEVCRENFKHRAKKLEIPASWEEYEDDAYERVSNTSIVEIPAKQVERSIAEVSDNGEEQSTQIGTAEEACINSETTSTLEETYPGFRDVIGKAYVLRGAPEESLDILLSSLTTSSIKQYDVGLKKWWKFCKQKITDPYESSVSNVLACLALEFKQGANYGSLNSFRSALALLLGPEVGQDEKIRRFFRGVGKIRPNNPKYNETWNPKIVLDYLSEKENNDSLSLEDLSYKIITLLALITGHRIQTLSLIKLTNITKKRDLYEIKIPDRIKTSALNRKQPLLIIPKYEENPKICPMLTLDDYINRTKNIRKREENLFISFKKPHKAVTTSTLSRWIKNTLKNSGIDINKFSAYSTRHASTSTANKNGVSIDMIRKTAGWTETSNTFANFYKLPIVEDVESFAKAVLNN